MTGTGERGTGGGADGTNGLSPRALTWLLIGALMAWGVIQIVANVYSTLADLGEDGSQVDPAIIWSYQLTSFAGWALMLIPIWQAVRLIRPPRLSWPLTIVAHMLLSIPASLGHVALMVGFRMFVWSLRGDHYVFRSPDGNPLLYEYRKDAATYAVFVLILFLIQWLVARYAASAAPVAAPASLTISDGSVTHHLPVAEIEHVAAAGNYVEVAWRGQRLLHRATLSGIEAELAGAGFVRIHRSRLVRKPAVRRVVTHKSGDFDVEMESGEIHRGSRRFRGNLEG